VVINERTEFFIDWRICKLANTASAKKRIRSSAKRAERNRFFRSTTRTYVKKTRQLIAEGRLDEAEVMFHKAESLLDKSARKGVIHANNAARRKGRLAKHLAAAQSA
jgi:small subunit ribosomal protein S20